MRRLSVIAMVLWMGPLSTTWAAEAPVTAKEMKAEFPADLGPTTIDVSKYPSEQQRNYKTFLRTCSICHTPARAINAPVTSYDQWSSYVRQMHIRAQEQLLTPEDTKQIVDFLTYDSKIRKLQSSEKFEALQKQLNARFEVVLKEKNKHLPPKK